MTGVALILAHQIALIVASSVAANYPGQG